MKEIRTRRVTYFGNLKTLERTHNFRVFQPSSIILIIKLIMIILLYMVATNSIQAIEVQPIADTDYVVLIDDSSSMANTDITPDRLEAAKNIALQWLAIIPNSTQVGVVGFSATIDSHVPPTFNRERLRNAITGLEIDYAKSGTDLDNAINFGLEQFNETRQKKTILLFTDGTQELLNRTIDKAIDYNISIVSFAMGSNKSLEPKIIVDEDIPEDLLLEYQSQVDFNFSILAGISNRTNGQAYRVETAEQLQQSFIAATNEEVAVPLETGYYIILLIAVISILELIIYAYLGAL